MAKTRDVLVHVSIDVAIRKRKCHRSKKHGVAAGERCLLIRESSGLGSKNYCVECAKDILDAANRKLSSLSQEFSRPS